MKINENLKKNYEDLNYFKSMDSCQIYKVFYIFFMNIK